MRGEAGCRWPSSPKLAEARLSARAHGAPLLRRPDARCAGRRRRAWVIHASMRRGPSASRPCRPRTCPGASATAGRQGRERAGARVCRGRGASAFPSQEVNGWGAPTSLPSSASRFRNTCARRSGQRSVPAERQPRASAGHHRLPALEGTGAVRGRAACSRASLAGRSAERFRAVFMP